MDKDITELKHALKKIQPYYIDKADSLNAKYYWYMVIADGKQTRAYEAIKNPNHFIKDFAVPTRLRHMVYQIASEGEDAWYEYDDELIEIFLSNRYTKKLVDTLDNETEIGFVAAMFLLDSIDFEVGEPLNYKQIRILNNVIEDIYSS